MRLIDRLYQYLNYQAMSAYAFEHHCELSNGYLGKQFKGKGNIGSAILIKVEEKFPDLNIQWLVTGKGKMIRYGMEWCNHSSMELNEQTPFSGNADEWVIESLRGQILALQQTVKDKNAIIGLLKKEKTANKNALLRRHS